jgi:modulator of FtsH protease HflK
MERVLGGSEKLVYDGGAPGQGGVVPYLPLSELTSKRPPAAPAQQPSGGNR